MIFPQMFLWTLMFYCAVVWFWSYIEVLRFLKNYFRGYISCGSLCTTSKAAAFPSLRGCFPNTFLSPHFHVSTKPFSFILYPIQGLCVFHSVRIPTQNPSMPELGTCKRSTNNRFRPLSDFHHHLILEIYSLLTIRVIIHFIVSHIFSIVLWDTVPLLWGTQLFYSEWNFLCATFGCSSDSNHMNLFHVHEIPTGDSRIFIRLTRWSF